MSNKTTLKPVAVALGALFVGSLANTSVANAADNPFGMTELSSGYMVADMKEGKCGAGMKKDAKMKEGKCGEGMKDKAMKMKKEGKCGAGMKGKMMDKEKMKKEGKCGEGKCGASMKGKMDKEKMKEGKCGGAK